MDLSPLGRMLLIFGLVLAGLGAILLLSGKLPWLGRLPGDVHWEGRNFRIYFPLGTSIVLSIVLTLVLWLLNRR